MARLSLRFVPVCAAVLAPPAAAQDDVPLFEAQPEAVMSAEAAFFENLVPVTHATGAPPALDIFGFEVVDMELYSDDGRWRWTEDFVQGRLAGDKSYSGLVEYGVYDVHPADLTIPVEVTFIGDGLGPQADIWQIGVVCAEEAECVSGRVLSQDDMSGWLDDLRAGFREAALPQPDPRAANYWWVDGETHARRVAAALNVMLAHAGARPQRYE